MAALFFGVWDVAQVGFGLGLVGGVRGTGPAGASADLRAELAGCRHLSGRPGELQGRQAHPDRQGAASPLPVARREEPDRRERARRLADLAEPAHGRGAARGARHPRPLPPALLAGHEVVRHRLQPAGLCEPVPLAGQRREGAAAARQADPGAQDAQPSEHRQQEHGGLRQPAGQQRAAGHRPGDADRALEAAGGQAAGRHLLDAGRQVLARRTDR
mmetsp:Transcript_36595/g.84873  ORF Transcript_36595/g.84873 Transcript_36595/m.84873 type:complete len:216 (+) Transcript_36595:111-758(+)